MSNIVDAGVQPVIAPAVEPAGTNQAAPEDTAQKLAALAERLEKSEAGVSELKRIKDRETAEARRRADEAEAALQAERERRAALEADQQFARWASGKSEREVAEARAAYEQQRREEQWSKAHQWEAFKARKYAAALENGIPRAVADGWRNDADMQAAINEARTQKAVSEREAALAKRIKELEDRLGQPAGTRTTPIDTSAAPTGAARVGTDEFERATERFAEGRMSAREYTELKRKYEAQFQ